jgi:hypothetical protein
MLPFYLVNNISSRYRYYFLRNSCEPLRIMVVVKMTTTKTATK